MADEADDDYEPWHGAPPWAGKLGAYTHHATFMHVNHFDAARAESIVVLTVYLWDAGTWCGVTDSLEDAQQSAAERIGEEGQGQVEAAWVVLGAFSLARCYQRTGQAWTARCRADGTVSWIPVERRSLRSVS